MPNRMAPRRGCGRCVGIFHPAILRVFVVTLLALVLDAGAAAVHAQQAGSSTDAGRIEQRIERPPEPRREVRDLAPPHEPGVEVAEPVERFVLAGAEITGSTVYPPERLARFYEPYLGREISLPEIEAIVEAITAQYRRDGYVLSRALVPPQAVELGVLRIRVIEGHVDRVGFVGARPGRQTLLDEMAARIRAERPLTLATLQRYLLLMADMPGLTVSPGLAEIEPDSGAYRLEIGLSHRTVDGFASFDNRGTTTVGPHQTYFGANFNSLAGLLERTRVAAFTVPGAPEELRYGEIQHEQLLGAEGTRASLLASRSLVDIGEAGTPGKENSRATRVRLGLSHPFVRTRELNFSTSLRFDALKADKSSISHSFVDRLRVLRLGADLSFRDGWGGTSWVSAQASKGLDVLGAGGGDGSVSRDGGRSDFHKFTLDVTRVQALGAGFAAQATAAGQISPHTLLSSEEFGVGGARFGRAYKPYDITGSRGAAGFVELQYDPPLPVPLLESYQFYGFWDLGAVWGRGFTRASMASAGGGLRFSLPRDIGGAIEVAQPMTRAVTPGEAGSGGPRVFVTLYARF